MVKIGAEARTVGGRGEPSTSWGVSKKYNNEKYDHGRRNQAQKLKRGKN